MNLIEDFIVRLLPEVDDLTEVKVTLVALHLLDQKVSVTPFVTEAEVRQHPLVQAGVSFPELSVGPALRRAVHRGALISAKVGDQERFFPNTSAGREAAEAPVTSNNRVGDDLQRTLSHAVELLRQEIRRMELVEAYEPTSAEVALIEEWLADGYTPEEIAARVHAALLDPRPAGLPPRTVYHCRPAVESAPPAQPSAFYRFKRGAGIAPPGVIAFRDLAGRLPTGHEYRHLDYAIALFGERAVVQALKSIIHDDSVHLDELFSHLEEREQAALALHRAHVAADVQVKQAIQYYEAAFGVPPSSAIAEEMRLLLQEHDNLDRWPSIFAYAREQGKTRWAYIRKLLADPSPSVFVPEPVNDAARLAFDEYRRRVNPKLDPKIAAQINDLAKRVTDPAQWQSAFDKAAEANALRWDYIRKVVGDEPSTSRADKQTRSRAGTRLPQVSYTEADREQARRKAAEELARIEAFYERKRSKSK